MVDDMGFKEFCSIKAGISDNRFIHALVEWWWPSTHTFHFPCGELGFALLYFVMLTGLKFGIGREFPYDESYSKLEEAEKMFSGITNTDISISLRVGYLAALTDCDIIGASSFDWGTPIMAILYQGLDEVSVLKDGKTINLSRGKSCFNVELPMGSIGVNPIRARELNLVLTRNNMRGKAKFKRKMASTPIVVEDVVEAEEEVYDDKE
ncbi:hypothetical protein GIB67_016077 [Kingdonia uniflora]|uniref:Aminotransferase-like plant mobile domain-containing protein n=1 Tax=Kingdonia uniflora TaxID=39325 RepID=A0A7J7L1W3_9MAGN|nr:hypothetical protein GIB67_016077 [Kingdonia uniflora]